MFLLSVVAEWPDERGKRGVNVATRGPWTTSRRPGSGAATGTPGTGRYLFETSYQSNTHRNRQFRIKIYVFFFIYWNNNKNIDDSYVGGGVTRWPDKRDKKGGREEGHGVPGPHPVDQDLE